MEIKTILPEDKCVIEPVEAPIKAWNTKQNRRRLYSWLRVSVSFVMFAVAAIILLDAAVVLLMHLMRYTDRL